MHAVPGTEVLLSWFLKQIFEPGSYGQIMAQQIGVATKTQSLKVLCHHDLTEQGFSDD